ncbi:DNA-binding transcriptional LysR family regulator [Herbaspirillum sp. Sphag1AN]|uniref:LysR substrate-binding domain-containing protein n=1 Tax=unclassified Herbaspirillum TaxID=2624150 RepID=UPI00160CE434|nr:MULTISPECIES: LysR substrate-binding domain-containing protein [unclassified Herbaspirillum]MBB3214704.1 DNA-binding transcriptional LysR family regulator [Herbaspirillum sp. Sphag1AN]MBB3247893.1 DNA-binding transcriptional LysR family regulator [Herbaspirillum sp. Sphag64]
MDRFSEVKAFSLVASTGGFSSAARHLDDGSNGPIEEIAVSDNLSMNNSEMLRRAVEDGLGVALLADWLIRDAIEAGILVRVLDTYRANPGPMDVGVYAMYPASRRGSAKVKAFLDLPTQHFHRTLGDPSTSAPS